MRRVAIVLLAAALLAGCGKKEMLKPADNTPLPPKPATAATQPTPGELLTPPTQARPTRFNEIVTQSKELNSDRFDMPPPG